MTLYALIPVKPPSEGKSRLGRVLSDAARANLAWHLFDHVLGVASQAVGAAYTLVVSRDRELLAYARARGAGTVLEPEATGLNAALDLGRSEAVRLGADAILILPADLPDLTAADVGAVLTASAGSPAIVIAPDAAEQGTNALLLSPAGLMSFAFGECSFVAHVAAARRSGAEPVIVRRAGLAFDVDTGEDYARLRRCENDRAAG